MAAFADDIIHEHDEFVVATAALSRLSYGTS